MKLVEAVLSGKTSITKAAKKIGIKLSTAKLIVKKYRRDGTFHIPKSFAPKSCHKTIDPSYGRAEKSH
jgi:transposase